jgi:hypothetical protein
VGGRIIAQQEKISIAERSRTNPLNALQEAIHYSFTKFCIYCFFPVVRILCALALCIAQTLAKCCSLSEYSSIRGARVNVIVLDSKKDTCGLRLAERHDPYKRSAALFAVWILRILPQI